MSQGSSLINLGDLSKPATVLIEKIANAVGVLYEPRRIKKEAEARARSDMIRAQGSIEINELEQRAINRLLHQESRKQENIEQIAAQAASSLTEDAKVEDLDEDWVAHFFQHCETVSDSQMQSLWARLLAGEASNPGTFAKRTVASIASLDKQDALLFTNFCQFVWRIGRLTPVIIDVQNEVYTTQGITFNSLKHLDYIGLLSFEPLTGYKYQKLQKHIEVSYSGRITLIEFKADQGNQLSYGHAILTRAGEQLAPICGAQHNQEFYEYVIDRWYKQGHTLASVISSDSN